MMDVLQSKPSLYLNVMFCIQTQCVSQVYHAPCLDFFNSKFVLSEPLSLRKHEGGESTNLPPFVLTVSSELSLICLRCLV
jgi:hypothetical protein